MSNNVGTLKELKVQPEDVVRCMSSYCHWVRVGEIYTVSKDMKINGISINNLDVSQFHLISRAPAKVEATPKIWQDMTPEEKGALLLAHHEGRVIEYRASTWAKGLWGVVVNAVWKDAYAYRIKPEPVVKEVVQLIYFGEYGAYVAADMPNPTHRIVFKTIDGVPDCSSIKMEKV